MKGLVAEHLRSFAAEVTRGLGIPKACARIIEVVALQGRKLSFAEISERSRISERSLRSHLALLVRKGIVLREVAITSTRRLVRSELSGRIERLRRLAGEVMVARGPAAT